MRNSLCIRNSSRMKNKNIYNDHMHKCVTCCVTFIKITWSHDHTWFHVELNECVLLMNKKIKLL